MTLLFTDTAWTVIGQIVTPILSLITLVVTYYINKKQKQLGKQMNGQQDMLLKATEEVGRSKGKEECMEYHREKRKVELKDLNKNQ